MIQSIGVTLVKNPTIARFSGVEIQKVGNWDRVGFFTSSRDDFTGVRYLGEDRPSKAADAWSAMAGTHHLYNRPGRFPDEFSSEQRLIIEDSAMPTADKLDLLTKLENPEKRPDPRNGGSAEVPTTNFIYYF